MVGLADIGACITQDQSLKKGSISKLCLNQTGNG